MKNRNLIIVVGVVVAVVAGVTIHFTVSGDRGSRIHETVTGTGEINEALPQQPARHPSGMKESVEIAPEEKTPEELRLELREKIAQKRREADALEARKRKAFRKWWQPPRWCSEASTMKMLVQCGELRRAKREEFDKLLAAGKVLLPPAVK